MAADRQSDSRPHDRMLVIGIAAPAGFMLLVLQVLLRGPLAGEDVSPSGAAAWVPHDWVYALAQMFAAAGHWAIQSAVLLVVTAVLWVRRRRISALVIAGLSLGLLAVVVGAAQLAFGRARPPLNVYAVHAGGDSFPSGHTAAAVVVGCVLAWLLGEGQRGWVRRLLWVGGRGTVGIADRSGSAVPQRSASCAAGVGGPFAAGAVIGAPDAAVAERDVPAAPRRRRSFLGRARRGRRRAPRPRWQCWVRRAAFGSAALVGVCLLAFALLLAFTPSVGDAEARVRSLDHVHGGSDPVGTVPAVFAQALVATEDSRFYSDNGLDVAGLLRAATTPLHGGQDQGGSTLDQQLAKQLYTQGNSSLSDKIEQVVLAVKLDDHYTKQQILEMYASTVYFGHGFYGLEAASCGYFGVRPAHLTEAQAGLLAGVLPAPSDYDPLTNLALARSRQRHVLDRLVATHAMTSGQADTAFAAPLGLHTTPPVVCQ